MIYFFQLWQQLIDPERRKIVDFEKVTLCQQHEVSLVIIPYHWDGYEFFFIIELKNQSRTDVSLFSMIFQQVPELLSISRQVRSALSVQFSDMVKKIQSSNLVSYNNNHHVLPSLNHSSLMLAREYTIDGKDSYQHW